jgi:RNA polymerase sigma-70 factor (ECF subfamily)
LRGIAVNLLRNRFRRNGRRRTELLVDDAVDPTAARRAAAERVAAALGALPTHYEAVLRAKYLDGGSVVDIAADRGETPKAVESLLSRARSAFRTAYLDLE